MISRRPDATLRSFARSTVSAQIHFLGTVLGIIGLVYLLRQAELKESLAHSAACLAFGLTGILVMATSATYHFLHDGFHIDSRLENFFEDIDHSSIYLFIAGTYTPFALNAVKPGWREVILILIWSFAGLGILYTHFRSRLPLWAQHRYLYTGLFVAMGWTSLIRIVEIWQNLSSEALFWWGLGAFFYCAGAAVYALKRPRLFPGIFGFHELWHVASLLGFAAHYFMVLSFYR